MIDAPLEFTDFGHKVTRKIQKKKNWSPRTLQNFYFQHTAIKVVKNCTWAAGVRTPTVFKNFVSFYCVATRWYLIKKNTTIWPKSYRRSSMMLKCREKWINKTHITNYLHNLLDSRTTTTTVCVRIEDRKWLPMDSHLLSKHCRDMPS